jgi:hypothetical protein
VAFDGYSVFLMHNGSHHFVAVRRIHGKYFELDSLKARPRRLFNLEAEMKTMLDNKYTIFGAVLDESIIPLKVSEQKPPGDHWIPLSELLAELEKPDRTATDGDRNRGMELWLEMDFFALQHKMSAHYYRHRYYWWELIPSATLTMTSAILAFLSTSELTDEDTKNVFAIVVGVSSVLATFLQTLGSFFAYSSRRDMHGAAASDLGDLRDDIAFDAYERRTLNIGEYRKVFVQAKAACKYQVPLEIEAELNHYRNRIDSICRESNLDPATEYGRVKSAANDALWVQAKRNTGFLCGWPIALPEKTMDTAIERVAELFPLLNVLESKKKKCCGDFSFC